MTDIVDRLTEHAAVLRAITDDAEVTDIANDIETAAIIISEYRERHDYHA